MLTLRILNLPGAGYVAQLSRGGVHKQSIADHLCEFMWRRRVQKLDQDPFKQLLSDIKRCYPGKM